MEEQRVLGRIEALQDWMRHEILDLRADVKALNSFKWRIIGASAVVSLFVSIMIEVVLQVRK